MNDGLGKNWKERLLGILTAHPAVQGVVLFGSRAMGTWKPASDIDLALEGAALDLNDLLQLKASVGELNLPVDVDLLLLDSLKNPDLQRHIDMHGVVWWRRTMLPCKNRKTRGFFWQNTKLKEIAELNARTYTSPERCEVVSYLDTGNITKNQVDSIVHIDTYKDVLPSRARRIVKHLDIIYSCVRPNQRHYGILCNPDKNLLVSTGFTVISVDPQKADPYYIYYYLTQNRIIAYLQALAEGSVSTYPAIKSSDLASLSLDLPPLPSQKKIAGILKLLDDKIELNNKINANLEAQAQALFKSWFVDFEPFRDGKFIDSELGKIPYKFHVTSLGDLCVVVTKGSTPTTLKRDFSYSGINYIKAESVQENHFLDLCKFSFIAKEVHELLGRSQLACNDIIFTIAGTIGRFAMIDDIYLPANTNQAIAIIRADITKIDPYVLYSFFIANWHLDFYSRKIQQAVQANLSLGSIKSLPILTADAATMAEYSMQIKPLLLQRQNICRENLVLKNIRDSLLPKLMSGEIQV